MRTLPGSFDEKELLMRLREGDKHAFSVLYEQYYSRLYVHAYNRLRDRETAKDLVHDLFANIWARRETMHINGGLSSYLYTAVRNKVIDLIARQQTSSQYIRSFASYLLNSNGTTDHLVREKELAALIEREIRRLPPRVKIVFDLSRREHLSHREIADKLGLSEQTVRGYIKNALKVLKIKFGTMFWIFLYSILKIF
ncbi:MAG TPA: RNA polymerase sigma-70 factor [Anseongella sp.]